MKEEGYHCYSMKANGQSNYPWATSLWNTYQITKKFLLKLFKMIFIIYWIKELMFEDYIGKGKDQFGNEYNFDFINDINQFYMMVGQKKYTQK